VARPFRKYQGLGNDFILIDGRRGDLPDHAGEPARQLCDRRFGIGADGLILALPPREGGDVRMQILNADGSEAEMCGNGIRCFARFLADLDGASVGSVWRVETPAGVIVPQLLADGLVTVDMGQPFLQPATIPTTLEGPDQLPEADLEVAGEWLRVAAVGMGNPHAVVAVTDVEAVPLELFGPALEQHPAFPARTNVHFVQVLAPDRLRLRVWERGAGPTLACGTGACATLVATHLRGQCDREATLELPGGALQIRWDADDRLQMTGPAELVFCGTLPEASATAPASDPVIDCASACTEGCQRPDDCPSAEARARTLALLDRYSLDAMISLANESLEDRTRRRFEGS